MPKKQGAQKGYSSYSDFFEKCFPVSAQKQALENNDPFEISNFPAKEMVNYAEKKHEKKIAVTLAK